MKEQKVKIFLGETQKQFQLSDNFAHPEVVGINDGIIVGL
jgi:hypothetical protein